MFFLQQNILQDEEKAQHFRKSSVSLSCKKLDEKIDKQEATARSQLA